MDNTNLQVRPGNVVSRGATSPYENYAAEASYLIEGSDASGPVRQSRTYTEFISLRDLLRHRWPGFILPYLAAPSLSPLAYMSSSEEHRRRLEDFLRGLIDLPCLYKSAETQLFLRSPREFDLVAQYLYCEVSSLSLVYAETFPQFSEEVYSQEMFDDIAHYGGFLQQVEKEFIEAKEQIKEVHQAHHHFEREYLQLLHLLEHPDGTEDTPTAHEETAEYSIVTEWASSEVKQLRAVIDAILRVVELEDKRSQLLDKQEKKQLKLAKGKEGRVSLREFFGVSKHKLLAKMEGSIAKTVELIRQHDHVINVAVQILHKEQVPKFKRLKKQRYQNMLAAFSDFAVNYFKSLIEMLQFKFSPYLKT